MKRIILVFLFASFNAWADRHSFRSIHDAQGWYLTDGVSQERQTSLKTIIDKDGHKTITDGDGWMANARNYSPPVSYKVHKEDGNANSRQSNGNQAMISDLREKAKDAIDHEGIGGAVAARQYTNMANGMEAAQNGTYEQYQQQREIEKVQNELQRMKTQKIIDSYTSH